MHVPLGHVRGEDERKQLRCDALFKVPFHVSKSFLRVLKVPLFFVNQVVAVKEMFLYKDVVPEQLYLVHSSIVYFVGEAGLGGAGLAHVGFIRLQETRQLCILLRPLPVVDKVLQRGQKLNNTPLDLGPMLIPLSEEADEVLI